MAQSRFTQLALGVPPIRRMRQVLHRLDAAAHALQAEQDRQAGDLARLSGEIASVRAVAQQALSLAPALAASPPPRAS